MALLLLVIFGIVLTLGARIRWRPAVVVRAWVIIAWRSARAYVTIAPATFMYLLIVAVTTWVLATSSGYVGTALLETHSSTLRVLANTPFQGLIQSAFWLDSPWELPLAAGFAVLLAPVERWIGTMRWLIVGAIGHVLTTLVIAFVIWALLALGLVSEANGHGVDVGVSYVFAAIAGIFAYRLARRRAFAYVAGIGGVLVLILVVEPSFTAVGHIVAFVIGLALFRVVRNDQVEARATGAIYPRPLWRAQAAE